MRMVLFIVFVLCASKASAACKHFFENGQCLTEGNFEVLKDVKFSDLRIKQIQTDNRLFTETRSCKNTAIFYELYGRINDDARFALEKLYKSRTHCGRTEVLLFSEGGYLDEGIKIGEFFAKNLFTTMVIPNAECASSCAVAFLGGSMKKMVGNAELMFHAPYYKRIGGINCVKSAPDLQNYYVRMLGQNAGDRLYTKTLSKCSDRDGWTVNKDAAQIYGIIK